VFYLIQVSGSQKYSHWNDINFDSNKLTINKTLAEVKSSPDTKVTKVASQSAKTNAGKRTISIDK
jgi:hypothetical protein